LCCWRSTSNGWGMLLHPHFIAKILIFESHDFKSYLNHRRGPKNLIFRALLMPIDFLNRMILTHKRTFKKINIRIPHFSVTYLLQFCYICDPFHIMNTYMDDGDSYTTLMGGVVLNACWHLRWTTVLICRACY